MTPRTLFLGARNGVVCWYRCALPAQALGCDWAGVGGDPGALTVHAGTHGLDVRERDLASYDVVVLQLKKGPAWERTVHALRDAGVRVVYEIDDDLHAVGAAADHEYAALFGPDALAQHEQVMRACDAIICSTDRLAERYGDLGPAMHVCRNGLDLARYAYTRPERDTVTIGWAGGTGHGEAMRPWLSAVRDVMRHRPHTRFLSIGQPFAAALAKYAGEDRVASLPFTTIENYPAAMTAFDIALAPAGRGDFHRAKSDLRFLEAAALGLPVVADPFVYPAVADGITGLHATTPAQVRAALLRLVDDRGLRDRLGEAARDYVREERSLPAVAEAWGDALERIAGEPRVQAPVLARAPRPAAAPPAPLVSVVVPAFNYAHYLPAALDSALAQDHPADRLEVIVVDDGSTDDTPAVLASYGDRVRVVRRPNGGLNAATSTGIEAARGELLTFLDADDTWPTDRVRLLVDALAAHPRAGLAYGDMAVVDAGGEVVAPSFRAAEGLPAATGRPLGRLLLGNLVSAGSLMVRASLRDRFHPVPADVPYQDWWMVWQVAQAADLVAIPDVVNRYRRHGENMNLGSGADRKVGLLASELRFRSRMLTSVPPTAAAPSELLAALANFDAITGLVARTGDAHAATLPAPDRPGALAALQEASTALDAGDLQLTLAWLVRSAARDATFGEPRALLRELAPHAGVPLAAAA